MSRFLADIWRKLTGSQIRLREELTFLAGERWAYVSRDYLSRKLGLTVNHISHVTSQLVQLGVVEKQQMPMPARKSLTKFSSLPFTSILFIGS